MKYQIAGIFATLEKHNSEAKKLNMSVQFKIKVTNEILQLTKECGSNSDLETIGQHCPIAVSLINIFPQVFVSGDSIYPFGIDDNCEIESLKIEIPQIAQSFIRSFDSFVENTNARLSLPEFEFEICISDAIISHINISEVLPSTLVQSLPSYI